MCPSALENHAKMKFQWSLQDSKLHRPYFIHHPHELGRPRFFKCKFLHSIRHFGYGGNPAHPRSTELPRSLPDFPAAQLVRVSRVVVTRESITLYETNSVIFTKPSFFSNSFNSIQLWVGVVSSTPECLCIEERIPTCSKFLLLAFIFTMFLIDITIIALFFGWQPKRTLQ